MQPNIVLNWPAMLAALAASFVFGFLWYGPLFGKTWAKMMGMKMDKKPEKGFMMKALGLQILGTLLTVYVLAHSVQVWRPSVWSPGANDGGSDLMYGLMAAFFTWLGFFVPMQFGKVSWEMRPWKLFFLNCSHDFLNLLIICEILAHWR
jgi:hypothetical protein